ncbi:MAG: UDP-2,4-diacetamido-2,4,6-trideoxy-beta-L-altropyranose hydrolase [Spirochaetia bacterium]|nr:UDP-2,4-diacetamido-2,4,6-trideoxy-beta-L-altropyranose hydrolase [Spirochaetia bacterium]
MIWQALMMSHGGCLRRTKKAAIRVDASSQIGTGHFMRCLTLADSLKKNSVQTRFVCRNLPDHLCRMLAGKNHELTLLNTVQNDQEMDDLAHAYWLGTSQTIDAEASIQALSDQSWDWLIVDHYALDIRWEGKMQKNAKKIMAIDDIADRQHDCDVLLDQNFYLEMDKRYIGKVPVRCQLLLGPRYALLREEFRQLHAQPRFRNGTVKRILIFFGGVDIYNYTTCAINAITRIDIPDLYVDVVIGMLHPFRNQIEAQCEQHGFICHIQTDKMATLMAAADLAIGAGGVASWERCALGLPAIVRIVAENQLECADALSSAGAIIKLSDSGDVSQDILNAIESLMQAQNQLISLSTSAYKIMESWTGNEVANILMAG